MDVTASASDRGGPWTDLHGVRAVVTGAGRGLGRGIALALGEMGASVGALDLDEASAEETFAMLVERKGNGCALRIDVTDPVAVPDVLEACADRLGGLDLLVNNAGVLTVSSVIDMPLADWQKVLDVNATGVFLVSQAAARHMVQRETKGSIVSIASINGKRGDAGLAHYCASKFAVVGFTQALAQELGGRGITVNAICPGVILTTMVENLAKAGHLPIERMLDDQILKRAQAPAEIARAIAFLHTTRCITGQALNVDGGTVFH